MNRKFRDLAGSKVRASSLGPSASRYGSLGSWNTGLYIKFSNNAQAQAVEFSRIRALRAQQHCNLQHENRRELEKIASSGVLGNWNSNCWKVTGPKCGVLVRILMVQGAFSVQRAFSEFLCLPRSPPMSSRPFSQLQRS